MFVASIFFWFFFSFLVRFVGRFANNDRDCNTNGGGVVVTRQEIYSQQGQTGTETEYK